MSQPIIEPATIPVGIAHQRPSPLDNAAPRPPPKRPPAILPSVQSLSSTSYSLYVLVLFDSSEVQGVNTFSQLADMERVLQKNKAERLMESGVQIMDPTRIDIRGTLKTGKGVVLDINCVFEGQVVLL